MRGRLDDRPGAALGIGALEDPRADEVALGAELHHQRRVGGGGDATGAEHRHRQASLGGDLVDDFERRLVLLGGRGKLLGTELGELLDPADNIRMWRTASTTLPVPASPLERIIAAPSPIRRSASPRLVAPQTKGTSKASLSMWWRSSAGVSTSDSSM